MGGIVDPYVYGFLNSSVNAMAEVCGQVFVIQREEHKQNFLKHI